MAYDRGANYIYRVNDDSEIIDPWARSFVDALEVCSTSSLLIKNGPMLDPNSFAAKKLRAVQPRSASKIAPY